MSYNFPFGTPLKKVEQEDKSPKKVFILGVYASAVHARWIGSDKRTKVSALAVASEPYIFWKGDDAEKIINKINIPKEVGKLIPASKHLNGPSGNALDELYLQPLRFSREDAWLCDLLPYSRMNPNQKAALKEHYTDKLISDYNLPKYTIPAFSKKELDNYSRREEIPNELKQSQANTIVLLGDLPIKHFLSFYIKENYNKLSDFGKSKESYGKYHKINIDGKMYEVLPLAHTRQVKKLGLHNSDWFELHKYWIENI